MSLPTSDKRNVQNRKRFIQSEPDSDVLHAAKRLKQDTSSGFLQSLRATVKVPFCKMAEWIVKKKGTFLESFYTRPVDEKSFARGLPSRHDTPPEGAPVNQSSNPSAGRDLKNKGLPLSQLQTGYGLKQGYTVGESAFKSQYVKERGTAPGVGTTTARDPIPSQQLKSNQQLITSQQTIFRRRHDINVRSRNEGTQSPHTSKLFSGKRSNWKSPKLYSGGKARSGRMTDSYTPLYDKTYVRPLAFPNSSFVSGHPDTVSKSIDMKEKELYRQLLQQFTARPVEKSSSYIQDNTSHSHSNAAYNQMRETPRGFGSSLSDSRGPAFWKERIPKPVITGPVSLFSESKSSKDESTVLPPGGRFISDSHRKTTAHPPSTPVADVEVIDDDDSPVVVTPVQKHANSSINPPNEQFKFNMQSSPYVKSDWLHQVKENIQRGTNERNMKIAEEEIKVKVYKEMHVRDEMKLEDQIREQMRLEDLEPAVLEEDYDEGEEEEQLPDLTDEMEDRINSALVPFPESDVLVSEYRINISRKDMSTLDGLNWLNDEVINFYMNMLMARGGNDGLPKVHSFNTFFYPKLLSGGHNSLKRWTRRVDVFAVDYILVPVHLGMHWCLAVVDYPKKCLRYFDSMGGRNMQCLRALREYLQAESLDKRKTAFDMSDWTDKIEKEIPQQMNGSDCGMFACKFAEYVTRNAEINFTQEHMPYFRRRMVYEILTNTLL